MGVFGSIKRVRMVYDQKGKPRGYAFIEYEHERDLKNAYKQGDGKKIDGRRVMVDVERGRTVEGWLPRRLGGGRGPGRLGKPSKRKRNSWSLKRRPRKRRTASAIVRRPRMTRAGMTGEAKKRTGRMIGKMIGSVNVLAAVIAAVTVMVKLIGRKHVIEKN